MIKKILLTICLLVVIAVFPFGKQVYRYSESPQFCNLCHVMNYQYDNFIHNGAHQNRGCTNCHLPNNNLVEHLVWKGIDGTKDVIFFYSGLYSDNIVISNRGQKVVQQNCIACHSEMVSKIDVGSRKCTDCHRRHTHKHGGVF